MVEKFRYWKYLGLSRETVDSFSDRISADNIRIMQVESGLIAVLCFCGSFIMMLNRYALTHQVVLLTSAFSNVIIYSISCQVKKNGVKNPSKVANQLILAYSLVIYATAVHFATASAAYSVTLMVGALIACQISFDTKPLNNLLVTCIALIVFFVFFYNMKFGDNFLLDILNVAAAAIFGNIFAWKKSRIRWEHEEAIEVIQRSNTQLYRSSLTDPLTGLLNRRTAFDKLEVMAAQACVAKKEIVCLIMDLDNFKQYNDTFGHPAGDKLLEELGNLLLSIQNKYNVEIARIGGEEFMAYWSMRSEDIVPVVVNEIREGVKLIKHPEASEGKYSTISIGIYQNIAGENDNSARVYSKADSALYMAKKNGRDRAEYYDTSVEK